MKTIWLVRHGETEFNIAGKLQGTSDSPLTAVGLAQIRALTCFFSDKGLDSAFSSDLRRAQITAQFIIEDLPDISLSTSVLLRERGFGVFEGGSFVEYKNQVGSKHETLDFKPEHGENLAEVSKRAVAALKILRACHGSNLLVVGHGGFNRCFLSMAAKLPESNIFELKQANCCVNKLIEQLDGSFAIEMLNFTGHLEAGR